MTIIHPILMLSHLGHLDLVWSMSPSREAILLLFFSQCFTVLWSTLKVLVNPRKLLRCCYALIISSRRSFVYPFGAGFSRLCFLHDLQRYLCFPFDAWPFRTKSSLPQYWQQIVTVTMIYSPFERKDSGMFSNGSWILPQHPLSVTHYPGGITILLS